MPEQGFLASLFDVSFRSLVQRTQGGGGPGPGVAAPPSPPPPPPAA